jgi:hypothetical protein
VVALNGVVDKKKLEALYSLSPVNKSAFDYFASRERNSRSMKVELLQHRLRTAGAEASRKDVIDLFRELEAARCGTFFVGRKGHSSRFQWNVSLVSAGRLAAGEAVEVDVLKESDPELQDSEEETLITHRYVLRPDTEIEIALPADVTPTEVNRVANFVRTLSFAASSNS